MISSRDPLPQLLEPGATKCRAELRLTEQKALHRHRPVKEDIRQHAQFFERLKGQVLRLIDDQQHALAVAMLSQGELANALQKRSLSEAFFGDAETSREHIEKIIASELGRYNVRGYKTVPVDGRQQFVDEDRLASTDLTGNDDETLGMTKSVYEIGHRLAVNRALEEETSVRGELERLRSKPIKFGVHRRFRMSRWVGTPID